MGKSLLCSTSEVVKRGLRCLRPSISPNSSRSSLHRPKPLHISICHAHIPYSNSRNYSYLVSSPTSSCSASPQSPRTHPSGYRLPDSLPLRSHRRLHRWAPITGTHKCIVLMVQVVMPLRDKNTLS
ncbi:hypothetical protein JG688_00002828 [Phytophthora aleatoria]|uniref:Uncharacterized protein n=1 Tax=Phytophthora aleatoria TaxID=2496075 RepID=A0A8J5IU63_9STRA|nr:hypothetical protein JG688_00002828 [Phytophthora aleatoria]